MVPLSSASLAISTTEQKSFKRLMQLAPSRFDGTTDDRAYDFLSKYQDRLFNLVILESHGVAYTLIPVHQPCQGLMEVNYSSISNSDLGAIHQDIFWRGSYHTASKAATKMCFIVYNKVQCLFMNMRLDFIYFPNMPCPVFLLSSRGFDSSPRAL